LTVFLTVVVGLRKPGQDSCTFTWMICKKTGSQSAIAG